MEMDKQNELEFLKKRIPTQKQINHFNRLRNVYEFLIFKYQAAGMSVADSKKRAYDETFKNKEL